MAAQIGRGTHVLFLPPGPDQKIPWFYDVLDSIDPRHTLTVFDHNLDLKEQFCKVDIVIDLSGKYRTREMADASAGRVRLWQILGTHSEHFDVDYWVSRSIPVANCPGGLSSLHLADCALMLMRLLARQWNPSERHLHGGDLPTPPGLELEGKTLGLIGFGPSSRELALKARQFKMHTLVADTLNIMAEERHFFGVSFAGKPRDIDYVIEQSDFVSLHIPPNDNTHHLIDARRIGLMRSTACLINVVNRSLVDETALLTSLRGNRIGGAGLHVFTSEPAPFNSPLLGLENVVATLYITEATEATSRRHAAFAAANIERVAAGLDPLSLIPTGRGKPTEQQLL